MLPQITNDKKLNQMYIRKNLSENRIKIYKRVFAKIYELTQLTPTEILSIAKEEQKPKIIENQIEFKEIEDRTITEIQYDFYTHLSNAGLKNETIKTEIATYRAFLNEYNIQLPKMINIRTKQPLYEEGDLPKKEDILKAINCTSNKRNKALIYFMSSSGIRPIDVRNMRIKNFLEACKYYIGENATLEDLYESSYEQIIPCFYFRPQKTSKYDNVCCTFCSNEAVNSIVDYLMSRPVKSYDEYLFSTTDGNQIAPTSFITLFQRINDKEFGVNRFGERFFKPKFLRKYFITTCNQHSGDLLKVRLLAGHSLSDIDRAYNEININVMRRFYVSLLPYLNLHSTEVKTVKSKEYQDLELQLKKQELENQKLREEIDEKISKAVNSVLSDYY
jgi:site-specific recombinase XerC